ncbi:MAG: T9SS type A sorting domain-containing protein [Bacteroidia bacterium]
MKQRLLLALTACIFAPFLNAQTFWSESFTNGCSAGCLATSYTGPNGAWTQTITGTEGADANVWFISCAENGNGVNICGSACGSVPNETMHISAAVGNFVCANDCGAKYDAGGLCGILSCPQTSRRMDSPTINCANTQSAIAVSFNYIAAGAIGSDECSLWYFDGTTWSLVQVIPPTSNSNCGVAGLWTSITIALPPSATGNPNVKIGFEWVNNDDGVGTDPSVAIDDVSLSVTTNLADVAVREAKINYNANSNQISIALENNFSDGLVAEVYSVDGKLIVSQKLAAATETISVATLATGIYIVRISGDGKNFAPVKLAID